MTSDSFDAQDVDAHVALLTVGLFIPEAQSLKDKRQVLKSLKDRIRAGHNVSVAELGYQDKWQRCVLGVCALGSDKTYLEGVLSAVLAVAGESRGLIVTEHRIEFI